MIVVELMKVNNQFVKHMIFVELMKVNGQFVSGRHNVCMYVELTTGNNLLLTGMKRRERCR